MNKVGAHGGAPLHTLPNIILADYVTLPRRFQGIGLRQMLAIGECERGYIESNQAALVAREIVERLPRDEETASALLDEGYALSQRMSWERVLEDGLLPALQQVGSRQ